MVELEGLIVGVTGKRALWRSPATAAPHERRVAEIDFVQLMARADEQRARGRLLGSVLTFSRYAGKIQDA